MAEDNFLLDAAVLRYTQEGALFPLERKHVLMRPQEIAGRASRSQLIMLHEYVKFVLTMGDRVVSAQFIEECIQFAKNYHEARSSAYREAHEAQSSAYKVSLTITASTISPTITSSTISLLGSDRDAVSSATSHAPDPHSVSSLGFDRDAVSSATSYTPDQHAVSNAEAQWYYSGLPSKPKLLYRTGKEQWSPPRGPWAHGRLKELCEVFVHPITKVWSDDLAWKVVNVMDAHIIRFTTIDVVRFKEVGVSEVPEDEETAEAKKPVTGPVTIWIGVFPESTSATAAHDVAQDILVLLRDYEITDVDIDYRESYYTREAGPWLL
ncbi:hypothetical protein BS47DRAFT_1490340 [Hydnum rufescens UP504]|uniref:Uncharacterized protein n=1 Tax=Hydnum rufescens UP504 TaxID=1448309 RepID=A0A9P6AEE9_9AGAM|nr:hypothetical protein BS47DRAFT_1490340 [Hydnum rufescens UP504]